MVYYAKWKKTDKDKYSIVSLICEILKKKIQQISEYIKKKPTHRNREQTSAYQWGVEEGQYRGEEMGDTDYWL